MSYTCIHFVAACAPCARGVDVETLRDADLRLPCHELRGITGANACTKRAWPAGGDPAAPGRMSQRLEHIEAGRCPVCHKPMTGQQVTEGGRVYSKPCHHLLAEP